MIEDGPTAFVPFSHLSGKMPKWTKNALPEEIPNEFDEEDTNTDMSSSGGAKIEKQELEVVPLLAKAGDIAFFVSTCGIAVYLLYTAIMAVFLASPFCPTRYRTAAFADIRVQSTIAGCS